MSKSSLISQVDGLAIRASGPWIKRKYYYLTRYFQILTKGMTSKWPLTFVDLFAGPGKCLIEKSKEEVDGSALLALQYNFDRYVFVEQDKECVSALKQRCQKSPKYEKIQILQGDCNDLAGDISNVLGNNELYLIFADPTKINIHFKTFEVLTNNRRADLLMNIQHGMDVKRNFKLYKNKGDSSPLGLFLGGDVDWSAVDKSLNVIDLYKQRIKSLGYGTVEYKDIEIKNTKNASMYFLFFASKHPRGLDFWKKITKKDNHGQQELF